MARAEARKKIIAAEAEKDILAKQAAKAKKDAVDAKDDDGNRNELIAKAARLAQEADEYEVPNSPTIVVHDVTPEAIILECSKNGGTLGLISDEGAEMFSSSSRYNSNGQNNLAPLLRGFDGDSYSIRRVTPRHPRY